jgi:hypothetical protein
MYQADFICTYKRMDNSDDQEQLYRIQLLQAFDSNDFDDEKINATIADLYEETNKLFKDVFIKARQNESIIEMIDYLRLSGEERLEENDIIFNLLFKFEYFDLLHRCIIDYLINDSIHEKYMQALLEAL